MKPPLPPATLRDNRDVYVAGRDQYFGVAGPAVTVEIYTPPTRTDLTRLVALREQPSKLLNARRRVLRFAGRGEELAEIRSWREGPARRAAWLVHVAGGQGRTRLGWQAADGAVTYGWVVAFVRHRSEKPTTGGPVELADDQPFRLVMDYAEPLAPTRPAHAAARLHRSGGAAAGAVAGPCGQPVAGVRRRLRRPGYSEPTTRAACAGRLRGAEARRVPG
jgi:hypothetical protein